MKIKVLACALSLLACLARAASTPLTPSDDDYTAITTAIANATDGEVLLGVGTFTITNEIAISTAVTLRGASRDGTIVDCNQKCRGFVLSVAGATLADLTVYRGKGISLSGGGVSMSKGLVTNCLIKSCSASSGHGGGVWMSGGTLADCEISGCSSSTIGYSDNALYIKGGTATGCDIHGNDGGYSHSNAGYASCAVYVTVSGVLRNSRIHHNDVYLAGIKQDSGTVVNCLIYCNNKKAAANTFPTGVYKTNGTMLYCTVFGNMNRWESQCYTGIQQTNGKVLHCISYGNGDPSFKPGANRITGGTFENNVVDVALESYPDNLVGDPDFVAAELADFRISHSASPAVGYGSPETTAPDDFNGETRDLTAPTVGAFEFVGTRVGIPTFPIVYANGQKQVAPISSCDDYTVLENEGGTAAGTYPVRVQLAAAGAKWSDGSTTNKTLQFEILAQTVLHETDGYEEIVAAIAAVRDGETILFADGTYSIASTIDLARPITLKGESRDGVILDFGENCRGFNLSHEKATLRDLTIYRCKHVSASNLDAASGGGIAMSDGLVSNCLIKACQTAGNHIGGSGIYMTGGKVMGCEITQCCFSGLYAHGNAIWMTGGTVSDSDIHHNDGGYSNGLNGDSIVYIDGGIVEFSRIHHNTKESIPGVRFVYSGTVRNCLIYANSGSVNAGGIYMQGGTVLFTTVHGNVISGDTTGISGIVSSGGTVKNSIFWENCPEGGTAGSCKLGGSVVFSENVVDKALSSYPNNRATDPKFVGVSSNDYRISSRASSAYAYATPQETVCCDIVGFTRDEDAPTCGAYEYDSSIEKFEVDIKIDQSDYRLGTSAQVEAVVSGEDLEDVDLAWYLDGGLLAGETSSVLTLTELGLGRHTLKLTATRKLDGKVVEKERPDALAVRPLTSYVNTWGSGAYPYATPETATNSIGAAVEAVWVDPVLTTSVVIAEGVYTNATTISIQDKIRLLGAGCDGTVVVCTNATAFSLAEDAAELCGLTIRDSWKGVEVSAGSVHDFRLKSNHHNYAYQFGAGICASGTARVWNGQIDDCSSPAIYSGGGGLYLAGGTVSNVVLRRCFGSKDIVHGKGGAVYMTGGRLTHAEVVGASQESSLGLAIYSLGGTLDHCTVTGNVCTAGGYAVNLKNTSVRNCLFAHNDQASASYSSVKLDSGTFENCTFAANASPDLTLQAAGVSATNTIFAECGSATNKWTSACLIGHCLATSPLPDGEGNVVGDPKFRTRPGCGYRLRSASPAIGAGALLGWMTSDATDLDGQARVQGDGPDIGCYETRRTGFVIFVP